MEFFDRLRSVGESKAGHVKTSPTVSHKFEADHVKTSPIVSHKFEAGHGKTILDYDPHKSVGGHVGS